MTALLKRKKSLKFNTVDNRLAAIKIAKHPIADKTTESKNLEITICFLDTGRLLDKRLPLKFLSITKVKGIKIETPPDVIRIKSHQEPFSSFAAINELRAINNIKKRNC